MSSSYAYDETGQLWPSFAFTLSTIITLPLSYLLVSRVGNPAAAFPRIQTDYRPPQSAIIDAERAKYRRKQRRIGLIVAVVVGWAVMAYTLYLIQFAVAPEEQRVWNPYDILGISEVGGVVSPRREPHSFSRLTNCSLPAKS